MPKDYFRKEDRRIASHDIVSKVLQRLENEAKLPRQTSEDPFRSKDSDSESQDVADTSEPITVDEFDAKIEDEVDPSIFSLPDEICTLLASDTYKCPYCEDGKWYEYEHCDTCGGSGAKPGTTFRTCYACRGTGKYGYSRNLICFRCSGRGRLGTECKACNGEGEILIEVTDCDFCEGRGWAVIGRMLSQFGTPEDVQKIANVMIACAEDSEYRSRGQQLHKILSDAAAYALRYGTRKNKELFSECVLRLFWRDWKSICRDIDEWRS